jgi:hypothetical protein
VGAQGQLPDFTFTASHVLSALPPSLAAMKPAHHRSCGSIVPPSSAEGAATPSSLNQRLTAPGDHFSPPPASSMRSRCRSTAPDLLRPSQCLEELRKTPLFLFDHTSTTGYPLSAPPTSFPFYRLAPPSTDRSGEHPVALHPKSGSSLTRFAPRPLHRRPPSADRPNFVGKPPAPMGKKTSPVFAVGRKGQVGWTP